ncbi:MAG TPA: hypothetical protein VFG30_35565 [Polyangiales bacterium]|nr:hypothetical protein [Polyangiales bacterium]
MIRFDTMSFATASIPLARRPELAPVEVEGSVVAVVMSVLLLGRHFGHFAGASMSTAQCV